MFSSKPPKLFCIFLFLLAGVSLSACGFWRRTSENSNTASEPFTAREMTTGIPFSNQEPENFQTEIIFTNINQATGEKSERRIFLARRGGQRLKTFAAGERTEISSLQPDETKVFALFPAQKIYKETQINQSFAATGGETLQDFLTIEWLNAKPDVVFENLGAENNLQRFAARLNNSEAAEIIVFFDENLKIPVRQEFYRRGAEGAPKTLLYSVELKNFRAEAGENLFALPKDYRKVSAEEFDKIVWQAKE